MTEPTYWLPELEHPGFGPGGKPTTVATHYCPACGRRYAGPGRCAVGHAPTHVVEIPKK